MSITPLSDARRDALLAALSRVDGHRVGIASAQHVGHDAAPVTRLVLDREIPGIGSRVLVKTRRVDGAGHGGPPFLRREAAALRTASTSGVTARTILMDDAGGFMLQSDLGDWPTLQDVLLGDDPSAAAGGMVRMATAVGRLHASTVGRAAEHRRRLSVFDGDVTTGQGYAYGMEAWDEIEQACAATGFPSGEAARDEVARLLRRVAAPSPGAALTHMDLNPTNVLLTPRGARLVDLEGSRFGHPGVDVCFLHFPFPHHSSPWGVLPRGVVASADAAYRTALTEGGDDRSLKHHEQVLADGAAIVLIGRLRRLRLIARPDQAPHDSRRRRGQTVDQIRSFLRMAEGAEGLTALQGWTGDLADAMSSRWSDAAHPSPPLFPAFAARR